MRDRDAAKTVLLNTTDEKDSRMDKLLPAFVYVIQPHDVMVTSPYYQFLF